MRPFQSLITFYIGKRKANKMDFDDETDTFWTVTIEIRKVCIFYVANKIILIAFQKTNKDRIFVFKYLIYKSI